MPAMPVLCGRCCSTPSPETSITSHVLWADPTGDAVNNLVLGHRRTLVPLSVCLLALKPCGHTQATQLLWTACVGSLMQSSQEPLCLDSCQAVHTLNPKPQTLHA